MIYRNLVDLSKSDSLFRKMAYKICKCDFIADDLVNNFYIKYESMKVKPKIIDDGYVYTALQNQFKNYKRDNRNKIQFIEDVDYDTTQEEYDFDNDKESQNKIDIIKKELEIVPSTPIEEWYDKTIFKLIEIEGMSIRSIGRRTSIDRYSITESYKKTLMRLKNKLNDEEI